VPSFIEIPVTEETTGHKTNVNEQRTIDRQQPKGQWTESRLITRKHTFNAYCWQWRHNII